MVINPGEITLELLMNNPLYYMAFVYVGALVLSAMGVTGIFLTIANLQENLLKELTYH